MLASSVLLHVTLLAFYSEVRTKQQSAWRQHNENIDNALQNEFTCAERSLNVTCNGHDNVRSPTAATVTYKSQ